MPINAIFSSEAEVTAENINYCIESHHQLNNHFSEEYGADCQVNLSETN